MKKKKLLSLLLAGAMSASIFVGCGSSATDWDYISNKGELVIGVTYFEPMNYLDADGKLTGFETEFAEAVCEKMGVTPKFQKIDWDSKEVELNSKTIDCIWNGMTISEDATKNTSVSKAYVKNAQVVVMKADKAGEYTRVEDLSKLTFAAENGSAGEAALKELSYNTTGVTAQSDALMEVASGSTDACVIDITMANAMTGEGTSYKDLAIACELTSEEYGVSFRTGSDMVEKFNEVLDEFLADGTLDRLAEKYSLTLVK